MHKNDSPKTIQIYLPHGNPRGIRIADITTRTVQALLVPRADLALAKERKELHQAGLYFLINDDEDSRRPTVYIGEAELCYDRLQQHNKGKDFWGTAIAVTSKTGSFTKAHVKYLEWLCCQETRNANRAKLENKTCPSKPFLPEQMEAEVQDSFEVLSILVSALGYPVFESIRKSTDVRDILEVSGKGVSAKGIYGEEGLVVLAGSTLSKNVTKAMYERISRTHERLLAQGVVADRGEHLELLEDYPFNSPSAASDFVLGNASNGWIKWKYADGRTLDEVIRKPAEEA